MLCPGNILIDLPRVFMQTVVKLIIIMSLHINKGMVLQEPAQSVSIKKSVMTNPKKSESLQYKTTPNHYYYYYLCVCLHYF